MHMILLSAKLLHTNPHCLSLKEIQMAASHPGGGEKTVFCNRRSSRKRSSQLLTPKVETEIRTTPKRAVEDLEEISIEDVQRSLQGLSQRYKKKDEQFDNIQAQLNTSKEEIQQVTKEKNKLSDDYRKTSEELIQAKQMLEQKFNQLREAQNKFKKLEAELQNEKTKKCKALDELQKVLQRKEVAFNKFIELFRGEEQSCGQEVSSKEDCDVDRFSPCSICMEPWTESGEHNMCSLSCGHFFGRSCIIKWISKATSPTCPQCLATTSLGDLREHYVQLICSGDGKKVCANAVNSTGK